jgi:hypothetical protein
MLRRLLRHGCSLRVPGLSHADKSSIDNLQLVLVHAAAPSTLARLCTRESEPRLSQLESQLVDSHTTLEHSALPSVTSFAVTP